MTFFVTLVSEWFDYSDSFGNCKTKKD